MIFVSHQERCITRLEVDEEMETRCHACIKEWDNEWGGARAGVIGSDVPWLECPACNALTWVITVTE